MPKVDRAEAERLIEELQRTFVNNVPATFDEWSKAYGKARAAVLDAMTASDGPTVPDEVRKIVDEQANSDALWFRAEYITEDVLQRALRRLSKPPRILWHR